MSDNLLIMRGGRCLRWVRGFNNILVISKKFLITLQKPVEGKQFKFEIKSDFVWETSLKQ